MYRSCIGSAFALTFSLSTRRLPKYIARHSSCTTTLGEPTVSDFL